MLPHLPASGDELDDLLDQLHVAAATRLPVWMQLLGVALPRNAAFDPQNKPYVGLHTPDIDGDPADSEFPTAVAVEHVGTFGERARAQR
jgi:hypothetical protein